MFANRGDTRAAIQRLTASVANHFAHEERLMRAARYASLRWHKARHDAARKRVQGFVHRIEQGETLAASELVEYLASWLHDHTRVADRMMAAALRNHRLSVGMLTFRAGTKPLDACEWVTIKGEPFEPRTHGNVS